VDCLFHCLALCSRAVGHRWRSSVVSSPSFTNSSGTTSSDPHSDCRRPHNQSTVRRYQRRPGAEAGQGEILLLRARSKNSVLTHLPVCAPTPSRPVSASRGHAAAICAQGHTSPRPMFPTGGQQPVRVRLPYLHAPVLASRGYAAAHPAPRPRCHPIPDDHSPAKQGDQNFGRLRGYPEIGLGKKVDLLDS